MIVESNVGLTKNIFYKFLLVFSIVGVFGDLLKNQYLGQKIMNTLASNNQNRF